MGHGRGSRHPRVGIRGFDGLRRRAAARSRAFRHGGGPDRQGCRPRRRAAQRRVVRDPRDPRRLDRLPSRSSGGPAAHRQLGGAPSRGPRGPREARHGRHGDCGAGPVDRDDRPHPRHSRGHCGEHAPQDAGARQHCPQRRDAAAGATEAARRSARGGGIREPVESTGSWRRRPSCASCSPISPSSGTPAR